MPVSIDKKSVESDRIHSQSGLVRFKRRWVPIEFAWRPNVGSDARKGRCRTFFQVAELRVLCQWLASGLRVLLVLFVLPNHIQHASNQRAKEQKETQLQGGMGTPTDECGRGHVGRQTGIVRPVVCETFGRGRRGRPHLRWLSLVIVNSANVDNFAFISLRVRFFVYLCTFPCSLRVVLIYRILIK